LLNSYDKLFHVSEETGITRFNPRPSPSELPGITGDVVFAISGRLLHNYLLPRDCPRVTFYPSANTISSDKDHFFGNSSADYIITVESGWYSRIKATTLYLYEFQPEDFKLIDEVAGYYVSCIPVTPISLTVINDCIATLLNKNVELRFTPSLSKIADAVKKSSLNYSLIRMRNANP